MAARRPVGATFDVGQVGTARRGRRRPGYALVAAWGIGLAALVGVGLLGQHDQRGSAVAETPTPATPAGGSPGVLAAPLVLAPAEIADIPDPIDVEAPAAGPITVTTPRLLVFGKIVVKVDHVLIALEARNNRVIAQQTVDVRDPDGGIRPNTQVEFRAQFDVPNPRPNGTMWVVVTAYDASGVPLGGDRRPFVVGAVSDTVTKAADEAYGNVDAPPLDQKRCGPDVSGWRCG